MIWYILLALAAVIGIIALFASTKPDEWSIQREGTIPGAPTKVFPYVDDVHKLMEWSPWAKLDPAMKVTYGSPATGSGANFSWEGNGKVGAGKMTITESRPNDLVRCRFDFYKPMRCTNTHEFVLKPGGSETFVTWKMNGNAPFFFKLMMVFVSPDSMMGDNLERGLANLKAVVGAEGLSSRVETANER
jgi:Polyketide cyclase / dehydrase and lipid transport